MKLKRLTDQAVERFAREFGEFKDEPISVARSFVTDPLRTESVPGAEDIVLDTARSFADRREFGEFLAEQIGEVGEQRFDDLGLWTWICLLYAQHILRGPGSSQKVGGMIRWALTPGRGMYRHLARGPYAVCRRYKDHADVKAMLLGQQALDTPGEVYEQLWGRIDSVQNTNILVGISSLYVEDGRLKKGVGGARGGAARRVGKVLRQLGNTYHLTELSPQEFVNLLPSEFDRFK